MVKSVHIVKYTAHMKKSVAVYSLSHGLLDITHVYSQSHCIVDCESIRHIHCLVDSTH